MENETVWLTQAQMVELFQTTKQNVSLHVGNVFKEGELEENTTVKEYLTVQKEGKREVNRKVKYYNLDVIISVVPTDEMLLALMEDFAKSLESQAKGLKPRREDACNSWLPRLTTGGKASTNDGKEANFMCRSWPKRFG